MSRIHTTATCAALLLGASLAFAHGDRHAPSPKKALSPDEHPWGREGDPAKATKTITVDMGDDMRFKPGTVSVRRGDTVRFVVKNSGKLMHEMVLGTPQALEKHAQLMRKHPGMEHDEPYMAHVAPGKREGMTWTFTQAGTFVYGCLMPGHWESGMRGTIVVAD